MLLMRRAEEITPEQGPDNPCRTKRTIQPERTMIRSILWPGMPTESARRQAKYGQYFRYSPISLPWIFTRFGGRMRTS